MYTEITKEAYDQLNYVSTSGISTIEDNELYYSFITYTCGVILKQVRNRAANVIQYYIQDINV